MISERDAKQFYGLAHFNNYKETQVTNAVNIAFTMTLVGKLVLEKYKIKLNCHSMGLIDPNRIPMKSAQILLNSIKYPNEFLNSPILKIARLKAIHIYVANILTIFPIKKQGRSSKQTTGFKEL